MKKIIILLLIIGFSGLEAAKPEKENVFTKSFNETSETIDDAQNDPGNGGLGGDDPAPIDGYLPVLLAVGLGMTAYFGRKKFQALSK